MSTPVQAETPGTPVQAETPGTPGERAGVRTGSRRVTLLSMRELGMLPVLIIVIVIGTIVSPAFLTTGNLVTLLQQSSELSLLVLGESLVLISGFFDLSLESTVGFAPMVGAWLVTSSALGGSGFATPPLLAVGAILGIGAMVGTFNGLLIVHFKLNAFITSLAVLILLRGLTLGLTSGQSLYDLPPEFLYLGSTKYLSIPLSIWIAGLLYLLVGLFVRYHSFGRAIYAIGGNREAARAAGIRADRVQWILLIFASLLAALAGLLLIGRIASATATLGQNMIFTVMAASVIGGISLDGGRGRILGALLGILVLGTVENVLILSQVASFWIDAMFGAVILIALVIGHLSSSRASG